MIRKKCRICEYPKLIPILNLGKTGLADSFVKQKKKEKQYPLNLSVCMKCGLVQLINIVPKKELFNDTYAFYTGASPSSIQYFKDYADDVKQRYPNQSKGIVYEIASNDGTLLKNFIKHSEYVLGIEPTANTAEIATSAGVQTIVKFFNYETASDMCNDYPSADIIMANNVVAHVDDLHDFMEGIKVTLSDDGIFIFEVQYFPYLLFRNQFDHVYHEHHSFFSFRPLNILLQSHDLKVIDVTDRDVQGGSLRVYATHSTSRMKVNSRVLELLKMEEKIGMKDISTYQSFQYRAEYTKIRLMQLITELKAKGKKIVGYGASAKGNTLLTFCGINSKIIPYIEDLTEFKIGKYTPVTHILVKKPSNDKPDYYLLLVWNYLPGILKRESEYIKGGGKFIIPIPTPYVL